jgi:hypothetical protein
MVNWYKETEGPILNIYGIKRKCEGPFQVTEFEQPKLVQMDKVLHQW